MNNDHLSLSDPSGVDLHTAVRDALADANPAVRAMGSTLLQTPLHPGESGVGPAPLRRLYAFYAHGQSSGVNEEQVRADLVWLADHLDEWVARQEQAQQDARSLFKTLRATYPLPAPAAGQDAAEAMQDQARALKRMPDHWLHQPWAQRLMGRWTEDLPDVVAAARHWLAERSGNAARGLMRDLGPESRDRPLLAVPDGTCTECCNTPLCPDGHRYRPESPPCCGGSGRASAKDTASDERTPDGPDATTSCPA